jgi:hypothetical protein
MVKQVLLPFRFFLHKVFRLKSVLPLLPSLFKAWETIQTVFILSGQQGFRRRIVVYVDLVKICECNTILEALLTWYMSYWVFGIKYGNQKGLLTVMERFVT